MASARKSSLKCDSSKNPSATSYMSTRSTEAWPNQPRAPSTSSSPTSSVANSRLNQLSRHFHQPPPYEINTPYSTERQSTPEGEFDDPLVDQQGAPPHQVYEPSRPPPTTMSSQPPHPPVLVPGPVEYDDEVLKSMSHFRYAVHESIL